MHIYLSHTYTYNCVRLYQIFKADPIVLEFAGIQQGVSCNAQKVIPFRRFYDSSVHHMRQAYAQSWRDAGNPGPRISDFYNKIMEILRNQERRTRGDIPSCWLKILVD